MRYRRAEVRHVPCQNNKNFALSDLSPAGSCGRCLLPCSGWVLWPLSPALFLWPLYRCCLMPPSPTLSPTDPVPRGLLTQCPCASSGPQGLYTAYTQPIQRHDAHDVASLAICLASNRRPNSASRNALASYFSGKCVLSTSHAVEFAVSKVALLQRQYPYCDTRRRQDRDTHSHTHACDKARGRRDTVEYNASAYTVEARMHQHCDTKRIQKQKTFVVWVVGSAFFHHLLTNGLFGHWADSLRIQDAPAAPQSLATAAPQPRPGQTTVTGTRQPSTPRLLQTARGHSDTLSLLLIKSSHPGENRAAK